jgi:hypothetical protein
MSRTAVTFAMLAVAGGCFSANRFYDNVPAVPPTQVRQTPSHWQRPDGAAGMAAAAPAPPPPRTSSYAQATPRLAAAQPGGPAPLPARPVPAEAEGDNGPTAAALQSDDVVNQDLVQNTMVVLPATRQVRGAEPRAEAPPPPPPPPVRDLASLPLPRIISGKNVSADWSTPAPTAAPGAVVLRLVNSKRINFNFEFKDPAAGAPAVELWGTQDLKNWRKFETVAHPPHTLVAEIKEEGLYGFALLARTGSSRDRPQAGDLPQVWVAVDCTRPAVQLLGAELNLTARVPTLVLRWSATDKNLGPRPITLCYAEHTEGPWTPIAANLENSGRYEWILPAGIPPALHVRIQAADLMGNLGTAQTTAPLHLPRPQGAAGPVVQLEKCDKFAPEPERPSCPPPRLVTLPPTPIAELPRPAAVEPPRPQVRIMSVEADRN